MRLVSGYADLPGTCFFTGTANTDHGVVDFDRHVDFYGRVYMAGAYAEELAALIGWHSPADYERLEQERDDIALELERAREALDALDELAHAEAKVEQAAAVLAG